MTDQPPADGDGRQAPRIALPRNIAQTVKYLDDFDLDALRLSVENELKRRRAEKEMEAAASAEDDAPERETTAQGGGTKAAVRQGRAMLPAGKTSLIRASFASGMKPQAIARTLRVSLAQVNEVLAAKVARKR